MSKQEAKSVLRDCLEGFKAVSSYQQNFSKDDMLLIDPLLRRHPSPGMLDEWDGHATLTLNAYGKLSLAIRLRDGGLRTLSLRKCLNGSDNGPNSVANIAAAALAREVEWDAVCIATLDECEAAAAKSAAVKEAEWAADCDAVLSSALEARAREAPSAAEQL